MERSKFNTITELTSFVFTVHKIMNIILCHKIFLRVGNAKVDVPKQPRNFYIRVRFAIVKKNAFIISREKISRR